MIDERYDLDLLDFILEKTKNQENKKYSEQHEKYSKLKQFIRSNSLSREEALKDSNVKKIAKAIGYNNQEKAKRFIVKWFDEHETPKKDEESTDSEAKPLNFNIKTKADLAELLKALQNDKNAIADALKKIYGGADTKKISTIYNFVKMLLSKKGLQVNSNDMTDLYIVVHKDFKQAEKRKSSK